MADATRRSGGARGWCGDDVGIRLARLAPAPRFFCFIEFVVESKDAKRAPSLANGGVAALAALAGSWAAFAGALAAATADTWATEIGRYSRKPPRLITTGKPVAAGTDGGMTLVGTVGGIAGAAFMAALAFLFEPRVAVAVAVAGVFGMLLDSLLGATVQGAVRWLDNDAVNLAATLAGAVVAVGAWQLCCYSPPR